VESHALSFVVAHPRGAAVLDAIAEGLELERAKLAASYAAWESTANMVSASAYRAIAELTRQHPPRAGELGMLIAFGIGVACEMALLRWHSPPNVAYT
jgi:alkylresorcinol/alkylpyrone synthase